MAERKGLKKRFVFLVKGLKMIADNRENKLWIVCLNEARGYRQMVRAKGCFSRANVFMSGYYKSQAVFLVIGRMR